MKTYIILRLCVLLLFMFLENGFAQDTTLIDFRSKVLSNQSLMNSDLERAYLNMEVYLKEAKERGDHKSELYLLTNHCRYFELKQNPEELIKAAKKLKEKAVDYGDIRLQAVAINYTAKVYRMNDMTEEAQKKIEEALMLLEKDAVKNENIINTRANIYTDYSNFHLKNKAFKAAKEKLLLARKEYANLPKNKYRDYVIYINSSNLAVVYLGIDIDSAAFFVQKSINEKPEHIPKTDNVLLRNYLVLAIVHKEKKRYKKALTLLNKVEGLIKKTGDKTNIIELYENYVEVYGLTENYKKQKEYKTKLNELNLELIQNKNLSLHQILKQEKDTKIVEAQRRTKKIIILSIGFFTIVGLLVYLFFHLYRRKIYSKFEQRSQDYLEKNKDQNNDLKLLGYNDLIEIIKNDDPAFMSNFIKFFPEFKDNLLKVNPYLVKSEIEFCALLKLNLSTKEIAQYKFIQPRTVQNKKYRIRKKLNIPKKKDIYNWFDEL